MGNFNCAFRCKGKVDWSHEITAGSVKKKNACNTSWEAVYASKPKSSDSTSIGSDTIKGLPPDPEQAAKAHQ